jgi:hypothetical protein
MARVDGFTVGPDTPLIVARKSRCAWVQSRHDRSRREALSGETVSSGDRIQGERLSSVEDLQAGMAEFRRLRAQVGTSLRVACAGLAAVCPVALSLLHVVRDTVSVLALGLCCAAVTAAVVLSAPALRSCVSPAAGSAILTLVSSVAAGFVAAWIFDRGPEWAGAAAGVIGTLAALALGVYSDSRSDDPKGRQKMTARGPEGALVRAARRASSSGV